ncbi:PREDICTED: uncharacterized protein C18orf63-like [Polistes canadensis]|uniref:uncharacterized protein C18orf63-like n=1 Tax=Polistes canadensis TaxID=91411 RepID=UPI000718C41E|nr:PREDICTED: uncharacterized protein C18orf63-like [Polistes canadensis]
MDNKNKEFVSHATLPRKEELRCIVCEIDFIEVQNSLAKSNYHWQTLKCRLIIHIFPEIIASPQPGTNNSIVIIVSNKFLKTGKLQKTLRTLNMLFKNPQPVTIEDYIICLNYTIECKLAPRWNKVGQYFILYWNKFIDENVSFTFQPRKLKIPFIQLEDFYLLRSTIVDFLIDNNGFINLVDFSQSVYALPSMCMGKVISVTKKIPSSCPFKDYVQLRRHWKNMYGYRLPQTSEGIIYYNIKFPFSSVNRFTYPNTCVAFKPIQLFPCNDSEYIISQFIDDICETISDICGNRLQILSHQKTNYTSSIKNKLSPPENKRTSSFFMDMTNTEKKPRLEFSSKYEHWLLTNTEKPMCQTLKPTGYLNEIEKIHTTSIPVAINNKKTILNDQDEINDSKLMNNNSLNYNETLATSSNCVQHMKRKCPVFDINRESMYSIQQSTDTNTKLNQTFVNIRNDIKMNQEVDIELLAKLNQLNQVNSSVLRDWLQRYSIPYKVKDKKTDLISKIMGHIKKKGTHK